MHIFMNTFGKWSIVTLPLDVGYLM